MDIRLIYITVGTLAEAQKISRNLVENRLVACVNMIPGITSMYWWEGKIQNDPEVILIAKTTKDRVSQVIERVKSLHSYACPCIVAMTVETGNPPFLDWIEREVAV